MPLIYSNRGYTLLFALFFLSWCVSELLGPARWQGSKEAQNRDRGSTMLLAASTGTGVLFFFLFPVLIPRTTIAFFAQFVFWGGVLVVVLGTGLRWWAIRFLGKSFTGSVVVEASQQLVQSGPYRLVRHPSYTGILLVVFGFGLMVNNWASLLSITIGMFIGLLYRILIEEEAMKQHFGRAYEEYMANTKRLVPLLF
jgi:protein-S-isoprenylcysteine O-methyltransferase Ste14